MRDLDEVYRQYADTVYRFLLAKTGSAQLAEELTQDNFFQAVRSIGSSDGVCRMSTWLCGIAKNVLYTYRRKHRYEEPADTLPETAAPSAEETALAEMNQRQILAAVHAMPEPGREILHLRLLGGLSFRQIGEVMGQSETWARVNFYRAKQTLIKELKENDEQ